MAKGAKLTKLIKKMQSFGRHSGRSSSISSSSAANSIRLDCSSYSDRDQISRDLHPVYVGKSRRRYLVSSEVIDHPLVRELVDRSSGKSDDTTVDCEVVLFEHLLWMLDNANPQPESLDELVEFYACW